MGDAYGVDDSERSDRSGSTSHDKIVNYRKMLNLEVGFKGFGLTLIDNKP